MGMQLRPGSSGAGCPTATNNRLAQLRQIRADAYDTAVSDGGPSGGTSAITSSTQYEFGQFFGGIFLTELRKHLREIGFGRSLFRCICFRHRRNDLYVDNERSRQVQATTGDGQTVSVYVHNCRVRPECRRGSTALLHQRPAWRRPSPINTTTLTGSRQDVISADSIQL